MRYSGSILLLIWVLSPGAVAASGDSMGDGSQPPSLPPWRLGMALGYGERMNPLVSSEDIPIVVDVDVAWFGERFFFDNGDVGVTLADNPTMTLSLVGRVNSDRVFFGKTNAKLVRFSASGVPLAEPAELQVPDRDYAVEAGAEMLLDGAWGLLHLAGHHDVSSTHGGYEIFAEYLRGWRRGRWYLEPAVGLSYRSREQNDYYWGVRPGESSAALPAYRAGSGTNAHARVQLGYFLSSHWNLTLVAEYERLNDEAAASPLVAEREVFSYFAGIGYRF